MKVATRITIATAVVVTLVSVVDTVMEVRGREAERSAQLEREASAVATAVRGALEARLSTGLDLEALGEDLSRAASGWSITVVPRRDREPVTDLEAQRRLQTLIDAPQLVLIDRDDERVVCAVPLRVPRPAAAEPGLEVVAAVEVSRDLAAIRAADDADLARAILLVVIVVVATTLAVAAVARSAVTRPIGKLLSGIDDVAKGDLSHVLLSEREDEIGRLATRFNEMTFSLRESRAETSRQNQDKLELEQRLGQTEKLATIGQLAAEIAHEVGTPLGVIAGRARSTQRKAGDAEAAVKNATIIAEQTARITRIIQRLLDFARRKVGHEQTRLDLGELAQTTTELLAGQLSASGKLRQRLDRDPDLPQIVGDPDRLQQVLINLMLNAAQAMPAGGRLRVALSAVTRPRPGLESSPAQPFVCLAIADSGPGIPEPIRERIFDPFFTTKEGQGGTGLGLAVCSGIVKEHDGWIEPPRHRRRPRDRARHGAQRHGDPGVPAGRRLTAVAAAAPCYHRGVQRDVAGTILVVEDDDAMRELLAEELGDAGYTVLSAPNAGIGLELARAEPVDVLITDLRMPEMDGLISSAA
ncbi:MAG: ATP-binding protein [Kofleriaceae bacterium]